MLSTFTFLPSQPIFESLEQLSSPKLPPKGKLLIVKLNFDMKIFLKGPRGRLDPAASMEHILYQTNQILTNILTIGVQFFANLFTFNSNHF